MQKSRIFAPGGVINKDFMYTISIFLRTSLKHNCFLQKSWIFAPGGVINKDFMHTMSVFLRKSLANHCLTYKYTEDVVECDQIYFEYRYTVLFSKN